MDGVKGLVENIGKGKKEVMIVSSSLLSVFNFSSSSAVPGKPGIPMSSGV